MSVVMNDEKDINIAPSVIRRSNIFVICSAI